MITSHDILEKTGIKSAKTLTRWHQRGLIPEPLVRTHPSGRGKLAYWPDWVLDRCHKFVQLQREGHSLDSAARLLELEKVRRFQERAAREPKVSDALASAQVKLTPNRDGTMLDALHLTVLGVIKERVPDDAERRAFISQMRERDTIGSAFELWRAGYNPVLVYDGSTIEVIPDFLVGWRLSEDLSTRPPFIVVPLLAVFLRVNPRFEQFVGAMPNTWPAPKVWVQNDDAIIEYPFTAGGPLGFELIREAAKVVSSVTSEAETDANDSATTE